MEEAWGVNAFEEHAQNVLSGGVRLSRSCLFLLRMPESWVETIKNWHVIITLYTVLFTGSQKLPINPHMAEPARLFLVTPGHKPPTFAPTSEKIAAPRLEVGFIARKPATPVAAPPPLPPRASAWRRPTTRQARSLAVPRRTGFLVRPRPCRECGCASGHPAC